MQKANKNNVNSKGLSIHEPIKKKNLNNAFLSHTLQVLSTDMGVPKLR